MRTRRRKARVLRRIFHQIGMGILQGSILFMAAALIIAINGGCVFAGELVQKGLFFAVLGGFFDVIGDFIGKM